MKPALPVAGAFVIGLVGSTLIGMRHAPSAPPAAAVPPAASTPAAPPPAVSQAAPAPTVATTATPPPAPAPRAAPTVPAGAPDSARIPADSLKGASEVQRLAGVFAKLDPQDVVPLIADMKDDDVVPVLRQLGVTKSAAVLALLPKARSHTLSTKLLAPSGANAP